MSSLSHWSCHWRYPQQPWNWKIHMWWPLSHWNYLLEYTKYTSTPSLFLSYPPFFCIPPSSHSCNHSFSSIPSIHHFFEIQLCICLNLLLLILWSKYFTFTITIYSTRRSLLPLILMGLSWSILCIDWASALLIIHPAILLYSLFFFRNLVSDLRVCWQQRWILCYTLC